MKLRILAIGAVAAAAATVFVSNDAHAAPANGLGEEAGQLILSGDRLVPIFSHSRVGITRTENNVEVTTATSSTSSSILWGGQLGPDFVHTIPRIGVDFTVIPHLTVGGSVLLAFTLGGSTSVEGGGRSVSFDSSSTTVFGFAPRVGYILPLGDILGLWLRGGFAFYSHRVKSVDDDNANNFDVARSSVLSLDLDPQLMIVPYEHFFFGLGPLVNIPLTGTRTVENVRGARTDSRSDDLAVFQFGINASVGGWFNL